MHSVDQQELQSRSNSTRILLMYSTPSSSASLLQDPSLTLRYNSIRMKCHQRDNENRRNLGSSITHQQRTITGFRYHPYRFRQPLSPQRSFRSTQRFPHTPIPLMGIPPGIMSQSDYERIHSEQVQRDKEKLVHRGHVLAPSNTTQFLIDDHNHQTTPSTNQINNFSSFDNDFNDIYYQCRYERYAAFSDTALLNEVLFLCANIDRLQYEKSEVEKHLRDVQQQIHGITIQSHNEDEFQSKIESNEPVIESILAENE